MGERYAKRINILIFLLYIVYTMLFKEYQPAAALSEWVECYWKFIMPARPEAPFQPVNHVFPPEGSCSLVFIKIPAIAFQAIHFVGPSTRVQQVKVMPESINLGIRLKPGYAACLHPAHPGDLLNNSLPVTDIPAWQSDFLQTLTLDFNSPEMLDALLLQYCMPRVNGPDERIAKAVDAIIQQAGDISLEELSRLCFLGERQLQRLFTVSTGISIKRFCQIRRLRQAIINLYVQRHSRADMTAELGFTDTAHFYKSFRNIGAYKLKQFLEHISLIDHQLL